MKDSLILLLVAIGGITGMPLCSDGWIEFKANCYLFAIDQPSPFTLAEAFCQQHNATLVEVNDEGENNFLLYYARHFKPTNWWIGLTDSEIEGAWKWINSGSTPTFTNWNPGEPESARGTANEDCAAMYTLTNFNWVDAGCDRAFSPVCEISHGKVVIVM